MPSSSRSGGAASPYRGPKKPPPTAGANDVRAGSFLVAAGGCGVKDNGAGSSVAFRRSPLPTFNVQSSLALASVDVFLNVKEPPCMLHR